MANKYKMQLTPACSEDLDNIYRYISETVFEPVAANRLMNEIEAAFKQTCDFPLMHQLSDDGNLSRRGYRKLVIKNYIALYLVNKPEKTVIFARVFYGKQDYIKMI